MIDSVDGWDDSPIPPRVEAVGTADVTAGFIPEHQRQPVGADNMAYGRVVQVEGVRVGEGIGRTLGTGVFIAPDILLTAAHVLWDDSADVFGQQREGYAEHVTIRSPVLPIPPAARSTDRFVAAAGYRNFRQPAFDLAVIKLAAPVPKSAGITPFSVPSGGLDHAQVKVFGYPENANNLLFSALGTCIGGDTGMVYHTADVTEGISGGPVLADFPSGPRLVAIHRAGPGESPPQFADSCGAVRMTQEAIQWIQGRINML